LVAEMRSASASITAADVRELAQFGVPSAAVQTFQLIGIDRVSHLVDCDVYQPDPDGALAFITPVLVQNAVSPESTWPEAYVRFGSLIDNLAWDPQTPRRWLLRAGLADWLGCCAPQYCDPEPVPIWRSPLGWFRANCVGVVPLTRDPAAAYRLLMGFSAIVAEDDDHLVELEQILARPWPAPRIIVRPSDAEG
jgi:hypothetical protein